MYQHVERDSLSSFVYRLTLQSHGPKTTPLVSSCMQVQLDVGEPAHWLHMYMCILSNVKPVSIVVLHVTSQLNVSVEIARSQAYLRANV